MIRATSLIVNEDEKEDTHKIITFEGSGLRFTLLGLWEETNKHLTQQETCLGIAD